jgi:pimeloyl-ACP methyl ester carboxylesterase
MKVDGAQAAAGEAFPAGVLKIDYRSSVDDARDWALAWPGAGGDWVVVIHGYGSQGDQLYVRKDIREGWLTEYRERGLGVLTPNLRGNAWMSPPAAVDMHELLGEIRARFGAKRFIFASGSMGGTSNLIYGVLHPEDVAGIVALGFLSDLRSFHRWCRERNAAFGNERADRMEVAYGGSPGQRAAVYELHSARAHAERLTLPVYLSHGTADESIPISEARLLVGRMPDALNVAYVEIPGGNHDSPLPRMAEGLRWVRDKMA